MLTTTIAKSNANLRVPVAQCMSSGIFVLPFNVNKLQGPFQCVQCNRKVVLRAKSNRCCAHFAHVQQDDVTVVCSGETAQHFSAKLIMKMYFAKFIFDEVCGICKCSLKKQYRVIAHNADSRMEYKIDKYIVDVAILSDAMVAAVIEIHHTHAVDKQKWATLKSICAAVYEVRAKDVLDVVQKNPNADTFHINCKSDFLNLCGMCNKTKMATCKFCVQLLLKIHMSKFNQWWSCHTCYTQISNCLICANVPCFQTDVCSGCNTTIQRIFPNRERAIQIRLFVVFKKIVHRMIDRKTKKREAECLWKKEQLYNLSRQKHESENKYVAAKLQTNAVKQFDSMDPLNTWIFQQGEFTTIDVPKQEEIFALLLNCCYRFMSNWRIKTKNVWKCARWLPTKELQDFAYAHRKPQDVPFFENKWKIHKLNEMFLPLFSTIKKTGMTNVLQLSYKSVTTNNDQHHQLQESKFREAKNFLATHLLTDEQIVQRCSKSHDSLFLNAIYFLLIRTRMVQKP